MTLLEYVLLLAVINFGVVILFLLRRDLRQSSEVIRLRDYRIALAYVASGKAYPSYEQFALAFISGNDQTLRRRFPEFGAFHARELERMEEDDG